MSILAWIEDQRKLKLLNAPKYNHPASDGSKGLWTRCDHCGVILYIKHLKENQRVCFGCGYHLQMDSQERIDHLIDENTWRPLDETLSPCDPLEFRDQKQYTERLKDAQEKTGLQDAVQTGTGMLDGIPIALGVMDFHFMGGSMGSVVGEKITRLIEYAAQEGLTLVLVCASGGARMQEGIFSLMQMAKISSALQIYQSCANLLYISVLTSPTTGGVTASFAMLGDLIFAEPKALIGFAGRRVIEQTLQEDLPDDFQTSEYLLHHGLLDLIVPRCFLKQALSETITLYKDAPFKRVGSIPYGVQNNLYFLTEEKARRKWNQWTSSLGKAANSLLARNQLDDALAADLAEASSGGNSSRSGATLAFNPQKMEGMSSEHSLVMLNDVPFKTALTNWLKDSSRDEPYRQILVSFQTMFSLLSASSEAFVPSSEVTKTNKAVVSPLTGNQLAANATDDLGSDALKTSLDVSPLGKETLLTSEREGAKPPKQAMLKSDARPGGPSPLLELAVGVARGEQIAWRAFYTNQKVSPKVMFLEHINLIGEVDGSGVSPLGLENYPSASEREGAKPPKQAMVRSDAKLTIAERYERGNNDKKFFYRMILNNSRV